jgi:signal peptidase I
MKSAAGAVVGYACTLKCELASEILRSSGEVRLRVVGWSMLPTVRPDDLLVINETNQKAVAKGDIVLFLRYRNLVAHRVIDKFDSSHGVQIITQGDGLPQPDLPVSESELLGKVTFVLRRGKCMTPVATLRFSQRLVAAMVQRSTLAARIFVHATRLSRRGQVATCQN